MSDPTGTRVPVHKVEEINGGFVIFKYDVSEEQRTYVKLDENEGIDYSYTRNATEAKWFASLDGNYGLYTWAMANRIAVRSLQSK